MKDWAMVLDQLDKCRELECDGMTRLISGLLQRAGVEHRFIVGEVVDKTTRMSVQPHYWIDLHDGRRIDYRLRMWLGNEPWVPHGIFHPEDISNGIVYSYGAERTLARSDIQVAEILAQIANVNFAKTVLELKNLDDSLDSNPV